MTDTLPLEIPEWVDDAEVGDYIEDLRDEYLEALDLTANPDDDLSEVDEPVVTAVRVELDKVTIHYMIDYFAWHPCTEKNWAETNYREELAYVRTHYRKVTALRQGRMLTFKKLWEKARHRLH